MKKVAVLTITLLLFSINGAYAMGHHPYENVRNPFVERARHMPERPPRYMPPEYQQEYSDENSGSVILGSAIGSFLASLLTQ